MATRKQLGVREARRIFPTIVEEAASGKTFVITSRGEPQCAVVPLEVLDKLAEQPSKPAKRRAK